MTRIAIIDDHALLAQIVAKQLEANGHEVLQVVIDAGLIEPVRAFEPELVLLDLELGPDMPGGRQLIDMLLDVCPAVLVLTGITDEIIIAECLELGVRGVLGKNAGFDNLVETISACCMGEPVAPSAAERMRLSGLLANRRRLRRKQVEPFMQLTSREAEVLRSLMAGMSAAEIGDLGFVSISTVRSQIKSILRKLEASSQIQAVAMARQAGWPDVL
ncbi:MAG: response regulator transcription factor, partial [Acidimicrobiales bacterium]